MSFQAYCPARGDIVLFNFSHTAGHEMDGPHFALVMSPALYNRRTGLALVLIGTSKKPIDSVRAGFVMNLPKGLIKTAKNPDGVGYLLCDNARQIDWKARDTRHAAKLEKESVEKALDLLLSAMESDD